MIHRIEIENYGSIREAQVIDLALPATTPIMDRFVTSHGALNVRLPTVVAFFGPNAAGKTTVLRAVTSTIDFVIHSFNLAPDSSIPYFQPFRSAKCANYPTRIVLDFDAEWINGAGHVYRYQLIIGNSPQRAAERVLTETLLIRDGRRFRMLFRRDENAIRCSREFALSSSDSLLKAVRTNASVVATMAQLNHPLFRTIWQDISLTQRNIRGPELFRPDINSSIAFLHDNPDALKELVKQLTRVDCGLHDMKILISANGLVASFEHEGLDTALLVTEESHGTQRFLAIFPVLWFTLQTGRPALIDEFDVDLHALLIPELLRWFQDPQINTNRAQLFLATHNVAIMENLEKEEIFLVEKSPSGASTVIPLRDIAGLRREPSLQRKYLGGVFGAIPNIG